MELTAKKLMVETWSRFFSWFGLRVLNGLASFGDYTVEKHIRLGPDPRQSIDHYTTGKPCRGIFFFIYGGNWMDGRKQDYRFLAATLCAEGFDVVIPDYRLYPAVRFNEIIQDIAGAMAWLLRKGSKQPVFVIGHSAGAQMGALICLNRALVSSKGADPAKVSGFVGLAGPYDFYPYTEPMHYDLFAPESDYPASQPVNYLMQPDIPMLLLHGRDDQRVRRGHSKSLMEKIQAAGGSAERIVYANMGHVEIIMAFSRLFRNRWPVLRDVCQFTDKVTRQGGRTTSDGDDGEFPANNLRQIYS